MVTIRPHKEIDIAYRVKWLNNPAVNKYIGDYPGQKTTTAKQKQWFSEYLKDRNKKFFTICVDREPIGCLGLSHISLKNKNADLFIMIGDNRYRGQGIGESSLRWLLDYGFNKLNLHKIKLTVIENNLAAVNLYKKIGFVVEGINVDEVFYQDKFYNFLEMAIFKESYQ